MMKLWRGMNGMNRREWESEEWEFEEWEELGHMNGSQRNGRNWVI